MAAFRNFVEKVFLPSLKRTDQQLNEWNRFNQYLNNEYINYEELYQYIDSINNSQVSNLQTFEKRELPFKKRNEDFLNSNSESPGFNPSKTVGGEKARMMLAKGYMDDFSDKKEITNNNNNFNFGSGSRADDRNRSFQNIPQNILPGL